MRPYSAEDVLKLRGTLKIDYSFAEAGAQRLWHLLKTEDYIAALGALTGNQAVQQVEAGLQAIYLSGWQVAADANLAGEMYPDQSLYPANSVPEVVRRINNALRRADQIQVLECCKIGPYWFAPIVADAEAGFGGPLNAFELMKAMIEAGAAGVHFEDQLASVKKCGHMGGKVLVPTRELAVQVAAELRRLADPTGLRIVPVYGGQRIKTQLHLLGKKPCVVVGTPGRLIDLLQRKAVNMAQGDIILPEHLPEYVQNSRPGAALPQPPTFSGGKIASLAALEKEAIEQAISHCRGNLSKTAKALGIGRNTLYDKIRKYNVQR